MVTWSATMSPDLQTADTFCNLLNGTDNYHPVLDKRNAGVGTNLQGHLTQIFHSVAGPADSSLAASLWTHRVRTFVF